MDNFHLHVIHINFQLYHWENNDIPDKQDNQNIQRFVGEIENQSEVLIKLVKMKKNAKKNHYLQRSQSGG